MVRGLTGTSLRDWRVLTFSPWTVAPLPTRLPSPQLLVRVAHRVPLSFVWLTGNRRYAFGCVTVVPPASAFQDAASLREHASEIRHVHALPVQCSLRQGVRRQCDRSAGGVVLENSLTVRRVKYCTAVETSEKII